MMSGKHGQGRVTDAHSVMKAIQRDQVVVTRVEKVLLSAGERCLRVGDLCWGGRASRKSQWHEPVILASLVVGRPPVGDATPRGDRRAIGFIDLERNLIGYGFGLRHGLSCLRLSHARCSDSPPAFK